MGDGNAGVIGILPRPGSLQGAGFLDEVRRLVRVRIWIRHQRQEDLSIEESSGKCLDSHRWDESAPKVTGEVKGRARVLTGPRKSNTFAAKFKKNHFLL